MNFLIKSNLFFKKPRVIIITGNNSALTTEAIYQVLANKLKARKVSIQKIPFVAKDEILIIESRAEELNSLGFILKNSSSPILVVTNFGDIPSDNIFFSGDKKNVDEVLKFINISPNNIQLILNFDDETVRGIKTLTNFKIVTFGLGEGSDFVASDIKYNHITNFKLNYQGNTVPVWLDFPAKKEHVYNSLAAIAVSTLFNLNLIEISQVLKDMRIS